MERQLLLHARHLRIGTCRLDRSLNEVEHEGRRTRLMPKAAAVLEVLVHFGGQPVSKERLLMEVWRGEFPTEDVVTNAISQLRKAFGDGARDSRYIRTVPRVGYALVAEVAPAEAVPEPAYETLDLMGENLDEGMDAAETAIVAPSRAWLVLLVVLLVLVLVLGAGILIGGAQWRAKVARPHVVVPLSVQMVPLRVTERHAGSVDRNFVMSLSELRRDETRFRWQMPNPLMRNAQGEGNGNDREWGVPSRAHDATRGLAATHGRPGRGGVGVAGEITLGGAGSRA